MGGRVGWGGGKGSILRDISSWLGERLGLGECREYSTYCPNKPVWEREGFPERESRGVRLCVRGNPSSVIKVLPPKAQANEGLLGIRVRVGTSLLWSHHAEHLQETFEPVWMAKCVQSV